MAILFGSAKITWTDGGAQEHLLRVPLQKVKPGERTRRYTRDSLDYSARIVSTIGSGVYEVTGMVRYDDDPDSLLSMLRAGMNGLVLRYYPDFTGSPGTFWDVQLVGPTEMPALGFDVDQVAFDEHTVDIRLRRLDGGTFSGIF